MSAQPQPKLTMPAKMAPLLPKHTSGPPESPVQVSIPLVLPAQICLFVILLGVYPGNEVVEYNSLHLSLLTILIFVHLRILLLGLELEDELSPKSEHKTLFQPALIGTSNLPRAIGIGFSFPHPLTKHSVPSFGS